MIRVHCPKHHESTPSCVVYEDSAYCYGGCGRIELSELGMEPNELRKSPTPIDIHAELTRIKGLATASVRGLCLPVDHDSYYIVWPDADYYKRRKFIPGDGPKYTCPRGHKKPLFVARETKHNAKLVIIEGELDALSLAVVDGDYDIFSPGGCGDFMNDRYLSKYLTYSSFCIIVDRDEAGLKAAIALRDKLIPHSSYVKVVFKDKVNDINAILTAKGKDGVKEFCEKVINCVEM